jgi:NADH-quinone oxidoreductase subunit L
MFLGIGVGAFESSFFHLWTHAFFKAGLFLSAGVIIHHVGTQDMRHMGGLGNYMKWLMYVHVVCGLALAGIPLFSGFMSKEGILQAVWFWGERQTALGYSEAHLVSYFAFFTLFLTAWYIGRQIWLVYWTPSRVDMPIPPLVFDWKLGLPVISLAVGSLWFVHHWSPVSSVGIIVTFAGYEITTYPTSLIPYVSSALALFGLIHCYGLFGPRRFYVQHYSEITYPPSIMGRLSFFGWYLDDAYDKLIAPSYVSFARVLHWIDQKIIDRFVNGIGVTGVVFSKLLSLIDSYVVDSLVYVIQWISRTLGKWFVRIQSGQVQHQIACLLMILILVVLFILF